MSMDSVSSCSERDQRPSCTWTLAGRLLPDGAVSTTEVKSFPFSVGRRSDASLSLLRSTVSGLHAELFLRGDDLYVRDLGSTNGTFVNGEQITEEALLSNGDLVQFADMAFHVSNQAAHVDSRTMSENAGDRALALVQFQLLVREKAVVPFYQPIVDLESGDTVAFEVLARSRVVGLESAGTMFGIAEDLNMEAALSELARHCGILASERLPETQHLFLNTHPVELSTVLNMNWLERLREQAPSQKLTIEVHEAAITDVESMRSFRARLDELQFGLAFDDFGAGQARIAELGDVRPDYLKFDRSMIMGIDGAGTARRKLLECLVDALRKIDVVALAEGIETEGELQVCRELGFQLGQGYILGRPGPIENYCASAALLT